MEIILIVAIVALVLYLFFKFKIPKFGCVTLVTGGVKTGKSMLSVHLVMRKYKSQLRKWRFRCILAKLLKKDKPEKPLLYSITPLAGIDYVPLTVEALERKVRLARGSVTYIQEASLVADSMMFKDMELNERLSFFNKLYGHETYGGFLVYDTQALSDCHYATKRALSTYFWIHHSVKLPFFVLLYLREMIFNEDGQVQNTVGSDVEDSLKCVIVPKSVWKKYDAYCFSALTDDLPLLSKTRYISTKKLERKKLKQKYIVSFRKWLTIARNEEELADITAKNESKTIIKRGLDVNAKM